MDLRGVPSNCVSSSDVSGTIAAFTRGDEVVRYPMCDGWVDNGGGVSKGLQPTSKSTNECECFVKQPSKDQCSTRLCNDVRGARYVDNVMRSWDKSKHGP